jgi:acyl carrier protein
MIEKIKTILSQIKENIDISSISDNADLMNDVGLDSLQMINFLLQLVDEFDIELDFDSVDDNHMCSLPKLASFMDEMVNKAPVFLGVIFLNIKYKNRGINKNIY